MKLTTKSSMFSNLQFESCMKSKLIYILTLITIVISCKQNETNSISAKTQNDKVNISDDLMTQMKWFNEPISYTIVDSTLSVTVGPETDFFNNPEDSSIAESAPLLYKTIGGDFLVRALIQPDFSSQWNAVSLMIHQDSLSWIKFAFENSDATGPSIVSVVTRNTSDDANGVVLNEKDKIWLAIAKKGNLYAMHWSVDGNDYKMARLTTLPELDSVKIGIEFQAPLEKNANHKLLFFDMKKGAVENLRDIN